MKHFNYQFPDTLPNSVLHEEWNPNLHIDFGLLGDYNAFEPKNQSIF